MADRSMKFTLDFLAKTAGLKDAADLADKLGEELDESADEGKKLSAALKMMADHAERELSETKKIAESLRRALGPDFAGDVDMMAAKFREVGVSAEHVDANIDELTASMRRLDQVASSTDGVAVAMRNVANETDRSRSVMANFAGNAAQEIPGVAQALGPVNVALGQFAEYAAEGDISLRNFAKSLAPMAGVSVGLLVAQRVFSNIQKDAQKAKERVAGFTEVIQEGGDQVQALADHWRDVGEIIADIDQGDTGMDWWKGGEKDITDQLHQLGLTAEQTAELVIGGRDAIEEWGRAMIDAGADAKQVLAVGEALIENADAYTEAQENAARAAKFFGKTAKVATDDATKAAGRLADAWEKAEDNLRTFYGAVQDFADGTLDYKEITDQAEEAVADFTATLTDGKSTLEEIDDAARGAAGALIDQAKAGLELYGVSLDTADGNRKLTEQLYALAMSMDPNSPLRQYLVDYIGELNRIPKKITTEIALNALARLINQTGMGGKVNIDNTGAGWGGKDTDSVEPGRGESLSVGRSAPSVNVTINATTLDPSMTVDAIERAVNDGVRRAWMAVS